MLKRCATTLNSNTSALTRTLFTSLPRADYLIGMRILLAVALLLLSACASKPRLTRPQKFTSYACQEAFLSATLQESQKQLNRISDLFTSNCFNEVIILGTHVHEHYRDKTYSVPAELAEFITPDGTWTDYILESYERSYLSLLMSLSYINLGNKEAAYVELRKSIMDENAKIYNHGNDPIITLLQAAIWSNLDPIASRPFWARLAEQKNITPPVRAFYETRLKEIDENKIPEGTWRIVGYDSFPKLEWDADLFGEKGLFSIRSEYEFPKECAKNDTLLIPTSGWVEKLSQRYQPGYHPLLYAKGLVRTPIGLVVGVVGVTSGTVLGVAGCAAGVYLKSGDVCVASLKGAIYTIQKTGNVVEYTMGPDLRHWENVPKAFYIVRDADDYRGPRCLNEKNGYSPIKVLWK